MIRHAGGAKSEMHDYVLKIAAVKRICVVTQQKLKNSQSFNFFSNL